MRLVIVTGLSGAGKSTALKKCWRMPAISAWIIFRFPFGQFVSLMAGMQGRMCRMQAIGIDARSGRDLGELEKVLEQLRGWI